MRTVEDEDDHDIEDGDGAARYQGYLGDQKVQGDSKTDDLPSVRTHLSRPLQELKHPKIRVLTSAISVAIIAASANTYNM
jgi:hypothetical protein